jgi:Dolichyl-phosphate-mannose-protein mannosyltransferase
VAICAVGLLRGMFWVATVSVFHPIDETQHFAYVESIATGHGIPVVGRDSTSPAEAALLKESPTMPWRTRPVSVDDPSWRQNHEGIQGPVYYAAMAPAYWVGRAVDGELGALYAVRTASLLLALAAIPLTWLLARELFPDNPSVWIAAPFLLAIIDGFNSNLATVTNDASVVPLAALLAWLVLRCARNFDRRTVLAAGFVAGVAMVAKTTFLTLLPVLAIVLVVSAWRRRDERGLIVRSMAFFAAAAILPLVPWILWNLWTYHAVTATKQVDALIGSQQDVVAPGLRGAGDVVVALRRSFWTNGVENTTTYRSWWEFVVVASAVIGLLVAAVRRDRQFFTRVAVLIASVPLGVAAIIVLTFAVFDRRLGTPGRYLYPLLPLIVIMVAAVVLTAAGRRWGAALLAMMVTVGFVYERDVQHEYIKFIYEEPTFGAGTGIVLEQSFRDSQVTASAVHANVDCGVQMVAVAFTPSPSTIEVDGRSSTTTGRTLLALADFTYYQLDAPVDGPISVPVPSGATVGMRFGDVDPRVSLAGADGDPVVRVYCAQDDAFHRRFEQVFPTFHVKVSVRAIDASPDVWIAAGAALTLLLTVRALTRARSDRDVEVSSSREVARDTVA